MSKHLGNVLEPIPLMDAHGADAVRWFMAASGSPWQSRRVGHTHDPGGRPQDAAHLLEHGVVPVAVRAHAPAGTVHDAGARRSPTGRRWTAGRCPRRTGWPREVDAALEEFDTQRAGRLLAGYVDDLSNWYVRRSRRRFWAGDPAALATLHECLLRRDAADGPARPRSSPSGCGRTCSPRRPTSCPTRSTWPPGRGSTASLVDDALAGADGAGAPAGRARPGHPRRVGRQDPPAAGAGPWWRPPAGTGCPPSCAQQVADELNVEHGRAAAATAGGDARRRPGQGQLPRAGQAVRQAHPRRSPPPSRRPTPAAWPQRCAPTARRPSRSTAAGSRSPPTRWSSPRPPRGLGGRDRRRRDGRARPRRSPRSCAWPGWPATSSARSRRRARPPASTSPTGSSCGWAADGELAEALREHGAAVAEEVLATHVLRGGGLRSAGAGQTDRTSPVMTRKPGSTSRSGASRR